MAPVLFLFLMNAFAESLEKIWELKGLERVTVVRASDEDFENGIGIVRGHTPKQFSSSKLDILSEFQEQLTLGCEVIYDHFARFGLEMHIGRTVNGKETASKTECVFFPRPHFFKEKELPVLSNEPFSGLIVEVVRRSTSRPKSSLIVGDRRPWQMPESESADDSGLEYTPLLPP
ncbi:hypothetical protein THAOC_06672, partial [Thalassiosira oceanica]